MPQMPSWLRYQVEAKTLGNIPDMAGSVADADAVLAQFGYTELVAA